MQEKQLVRAHVIVSGFVQGVAFRAFTKHEAMSRGLAGWVRNLDDGRVELEVEGDQARVEEFIGRLSKGPPLASVAACDVNWKIPQNEEKAFRIAY